MKNESISTGLPTVIRNFGLPKYGKFSKHRKSGLNGFKIIAELCWSTLFNHVV